MNAMTIWWWFEDISGYIKEAIQKFVSPIIGNGTSPLTQNHLWRDRPPWLIITTMNRVTHEWWWFWGRGRKIKKRLMMTSMRWPMTGQTTLVGSRAISSKRGSSHPASRCHHCHHFHYHQLGPPINAAGKQNQIYHQRPIYIRILIVRTFSKTVGGWGPRVLNLLVRRKNNMAYLTIISI